MGKNCVFFGRAKAFAQNNSQKSDFLGESSGIHFFIIFLLRGHVFLLCFLGCPRLPEDCAKKRIFFVSKK